VYENGRQAHQQTTAQTRAREAAKGGGGRKEEQRRTKGKDRRERRESKGGRAPPYARGQKKNKMKNDPKNHNKPGRGGGFTLFPGGISSPAYVLSVHLLSLSLSLCLLSW
jgi:hypothetical protein